MNVLQELDLTSNMLYTVPKYTEINLKTVKSLSLGKNTIVNALGMYALKGYIDLEHLNLVRNSIDRISETAFQHTPNLKVLILKENKIHRLSKNTFLGLKHIQVLDLAGNNIEHFDPQTFIQTPFLQDLDISNNKDLGRSISSGITQAFKPVQYLRSLKMIGVGLQDLPESTFAILLNFPQLL